MNIEKYIPSIDLRFSSLKNQSLKMDLGFDIPMYQILNIIVLFKR